MNLIQISGGKGFGPIVMIAGKGEEGMIVVVKCFFMLVKVSKKDSWLKVRLTSISF